MSSGVKTCRKCLLEKSLEGFRQHTGREGRRHTCRECEAVEARTWRAANPEKVKTATTKWNSENAAHLAAKKRAWCRQNPEKQDAYARKVHYGITDAEYQALLLTQKGLCAICGGPPTRKRRSLSVDHCHQTGKIRGLLCGPCNTGLGQFKDLPELLEKALQYLRS